MEIATTRQRILVVALLAPLIAFAVACGSDPVKPAESTDGISFDYSGVLNGKFRASGTPTRTSTAFLTSFFYATAMTYLPTEGTRAGTISIVANDYSGANYGNFLTFQGIPAKVTTVPLGGTVGATLYLSLNWNSFRFGADSVFLLGSGELAVTEYSGTRVRGTFWGTANLSSRGNIRPDRAITITNGRFDLAMNDTVAVDFRCRLFSC